MSTDRTGRWRTVAEVLGYLRNSPRPTRAGLAGALRLSSSSATEVTARMRRWRLLSEEAAPVSGRGRPTTVLRPHPDGPLAFVLEFRPDGFRSAFVALDGRLDDVRDHPPAMERPERVLAAARETLRRARDERPGRVRVVSLAVAATVQDGRLVQSATLGWGPVELGVLTELPLLVGNDATLAGVAEARTGAAVGASTALHLLVDVGVGGGLIVDRRAVTGATGAGGEVGHVPFGDPALRCPCGATGCWDPEVDGRALARHLGDEPPADARRYAHDVLDRVVSGDPAATHAVRRVIDALARGTAGLVNLHDPAVVSLGGLAPAFRAVDADRFRTVYEAGLMAFRRDRPPPVRDAVHGDLGALQGAAELAVDHLTTEAALAEWRQVIG